MLPVSSDLVLQLHDFIGNIHFKTVHISYTEIKPFILGYCEEAALTPSPLRSALCLLILNILFLFKIFVSLFVFQLN